MLRNIFFDYDSHELKDISFTELQRVENLLIRNPDITIEIIGHTDNQGSDTYNNNLSLRRAESVRNYLTERGIAAKRISAKGKGASTPISTNDTEEGRALNRRIEMRIVK